MYRIIWCTPPSYSSVTPPAFRVCVRNQSIGRGDSSISGMPGCGPIALPKTAVSSLYLNNLAS